jgi:hypothetical protein
VSNELYVAVAVISTPNVYFFQEAEQLMDDDDDSEEEAGDAMEVEEEVNSDDGENITYLSAVGLAVFTFVTCCLLLSQYCLSLFHFLCRLAEVNRWSASQYVRLL